MRWLLLLLVSVVTASAQLPGVNLLRVTVPASGGGGGGGVTATYLGVATSAADLSTYTFSSQPLGTATSDRYIFVFVGGRRAAAFAGVSMTIGGVSASFVAGTNYTTGGSCTLGEWWYANVPTGTTGDIVVTFDNAALRAGIEFYGVTGLGSISGFDFAAASAASQSTTVTAVSSGSILSGGSISLSGGNKYTWSGNVTENDDSGAPSSEALTVSCASTNGPAAGSFVVDVTASSSGLQTLVTLSLAP